MCGINNLSSSLHWYLPGWLTCGGLTGSDLGALCTELGPGKRNVHTRRDVVFMLAIMTTKIYFVSVTIIVFVQITATVTQNAVCAAERILCLVACILIETLRANSCNYVRIALRPMLKRLKLREHMHDCANIPNHVVFVSNNYVRVRDCASPFNSTYTLTNTENLLQRRTSAHTQQNASNYAVCYVFFAMTWQVYSNALYFMCTRRVQSAIESEYYTSTTSIHTWWPSNATHL